MAEHDYDTLPVAQLPTELFREVLTYLPEPQIVILRLVCKAWRELIDYDSWTSRVLCWKEDTECLHKPESSVAERISQSADKLRYLDIDLYTSDFNLCKLLLFCRLQTLIIRHFRYPDDFLADFCGILPGLSLTRLALDELEFDHLEKLHKILPDCLSLRTLELSLFWPLDHELIKASELIQSLDNYGLDSEEGFDFELHRDPNYHLPQLRDLKMAFIFYPLGFDYPEREYDTFGQLHRHLVKILLAATEISSLSLTRILRSSDESEMRTMGNIVYFGGDVVIYSRLIPVLGKTHKKLKRAELVNVAVESWMLNYLEDLVMADIRPSDTRADLEKPDLSESRLKRLVLSWPSGEHPEARVIREIPFSPEMVEYRAYGGPGTGVAGLLKILRSMSEPMKSMRCIVLEATHDKHREDSDFFHDDDLYLLARNFPNLATLVLVDHFKCSQSPESLLRASLPALHTLRVVELD